MQTNNPVPRTFWSPGTFPGKYEEQKKEKKSPSKSWGELTHIYTFSWTKNTLARVQTTMQHFMIQIMITWSHVGLVKVRAFQSFYFFGTIWIWDGVYMNHTQTPGSCHKGNGWRQLLGTLTKTARLKNYETCRDEFELDLYLKFFFFNL